MWLLIQQAFSSGLICSTWAGGTPLAGQVRGQVRGERELWKGPKFPPVLQRKQAMEARGPTTWVETLLLNVTLRKKTETTAKTFPNEMHTSAGR